MVECGVGRTKSSSNPGLPLRDKSGPTEIHIQKSQTHANSCHAPGAQQPVEKTVIALRTGITLADCTRKRPGVPSAGRTARSASRRRAIVLLIFWPCSPRSLHSYRGPAGGSSNRIEDPVRRLVQGLRRLLAEHGLVLGGEAAEMEEPGVERGYFDCADNGRAALQRAPGEMFLPSPDPLRAPPKPVP